MLVRKKAEEWGPAAAIRAEKRGEERGSCFVGVGWRRQTRSKTKKEWEWGSVGVF